MLQHGSASIGLRLLRKYQSNISLAEWEDRLGSTAHLYQVLARLVAVLAINALEDDARHMMMELPKDK